MSTADNPAQEKKKKKGRGVFIAVIIVLVVALAGAIGMGVVKGAGSKGERPGPGGSPDGSEEQIYAVNTTPVVLGPIADYFEINGEVVSASSVEVYSDAAGILARLYVGLGDYVYDGQVIAEVDPSRPGLNYALSPVKARASGTITSLPMDRGDTVAPGVTPVAAIGDLRRLQVIAAIPERFISRISLGMEAQVSLEAWPGHVIPLKVTQIDPVVDPASRTMEIKMDLPANEIKAKAGMYAEVRLTTDKKDEVVKIPADTILRRLGETFVYVIDGDVAHKRLIVPGITLGGVVEIIDGLEEGERIAYQGQTLLEDGVQVRIVREVKVID